MTARKARNKPEDECSGEAGTHGKTRLRSKRKVRFQDEQQSEGSERLAATPRSEWRPDQVAVAEGAKRQRQEVEDADIR